MNDYAHAASTLADAEKWREVERDLVSCGMDPRDVTPEWLIALARARIQRGPGYFEPEYVGFRCYEDVYR